MQTLIDSAIFIVIFVLVFWGFYALFRRRS